MNENEQNLHDLYVGLIINGMCSRTNAVTEKDVRQAFDLAKFMIEERQRRMDVKKVKAK